MNCPKCGFEMTTPTSSGFTRCRMCGYATWCGSSENNKSDKKEEKEYEKCPSCGGDHISSSLNGKNCVCLKCGWKWGWDKENMNSKPEPEIPENTIYDSLADECKLMFTKFLTRGFTEDQALDLTRNLMIIAIREGERKEEIDRMRKRLKVGK